MKKLFAKIKNNLPTGLTAKLIRAVVIIFFIIGSEFFINYKVRFNFGKSSGGEAKSAKEG